MLPCAAVSAELPQSRRSKTKPTGAGFLLCKPVLSERGAETREPGNEDP